MQLGTRSGGLCPHFSRLILFHFLRFHFASPASSILDQGKWSTKFFSNDKAASIATMFVFKYFKYIDTARHGYCATWISKSSFVQCVWVSNLNP